MGTHDEALALIQVIEQRANEVAFEREDVRRTFHLKIVDCLNAFFFGHLGISLCQQIEGGDLKLQMQGQVPRPEGLEKLLCMCRPPWHQAYHSSLNRHLIMDTWAAFESCVEVVTRAALDTTDIEALEQIKYGETMNILKRGGLQPDAQTNGRLLRTLGNPHIPIPRMVASLLKPNRSQYARDYSDDVAFLGLYGRLRNASHANFVYRGAEASVTWHDVEFRFRDGEFVWFSCEEKEVPGLLLSMVDELSRVYEAMVVVVNNRLLRDPWQAAWK